MSVFHRAGIVAMLVVSLPAHGAEPVRARDWRPLTPADVALPVIPQPFWVDAGAMPATRASQWVQIDPATGQMLPGPIPAMQQAPMLQRSAPPPLRLRTNSRGQLLLDTRGVRSVMRAELDARGDVHLDCVDPSHAHGGGDAASTNASDAEAQR